MFFPCADLHKYFQQCFKMSYLQKFQSADIQRVSKETMTFLMHENFNVQSKDHKHNLTSFFITLILLIHKPLSVGLPYSIFFQTKYFLSNKKKFCSTKHEQESNAINRLFFSSVKRIMLWKMLWLSCSPVVGCDGCMSEGPLWGVLYFDDVWGGPLCRLCCHTMDYTADYARYVVLSKLFCCLIM